MALTIKELETTHPEYNPVIQAASGVDGAPLRALTTYADFYGGGRNFEHNKDKYLRRRPIEKEPGAESFRHARLACAYYTPHCGGIGDNLCGTALQFPPLISVLKTDDSEEDDPRADYWIDLNQNIDGRGGDTRALAWCLLLNLIMHRRAYIVVNSLDGNDATFSPLGACEVDDWEYDDGGELLWVRTHCVELIRSKGEYSPADTEQHTWVFYTDENTVEFQATRPAGAKIWPSDMPPLEGKTEAHGLGFCPVFPIEVEENFWVMDRLYSTANAFFNREATRSFAIDTGALTLPVVKTNRDIMKLVIAAGMCIKLNADSNEDFKFASQDEGIYKAQQDDCEYLLGNLYGALNQMALQAANKDRMSGTKATEDKAPIKSFLSLLCTPIISALRKAVKANQKYRGEEDMIIMTSGMDKFDVQSIELSINRTATLQSIPGIPDTWRKEDIKKMVRTVHPEMDKDTWAKGEKELEEADLPVVGSKQDMVMGAQGNPTMQNGTTGRPQGFSPDQISQASTKMNTGPNAGKKKQELQTA